MNEQAGLWRPRPEPGGSSAGMAGRGAGASGGELLLTAATVSGVRPSMHHRSFDKQRIEWKGEIEDMRIIASFCRVHLDLESQKPCHDVR